MSRTAPGPDEVDPLLVDAALDGRIWASDLTAGERAHVIEQLHARGDTAQLIAERLHCSKRLVQKVRATHRNTA